MPPRVSVILLAWNGAAYLGPCLEALLAQASPADEVIVVDNASTDASPEIAAGLAPRVRLIRNAVNLGFAGGNNVGLRAAAGEVLVLLNQDTVVQPGWLDELVATFADPAIGVAGCKALYPDGKTLQHAGAQVSGDNAFARHVGLGEVDAGQYDQLLDMDYVTGAAFATHRRAFERLGCLDEEFHPAFYEEIDYCYRARRAGFRVVYQPRAAFLHYETTSLPAQSYGRLRAFHRGRTRFVLRHWEAEALERFAAAERPAIAETRWEADAEARAHAYFDALLMLPGVMALRRTDETLGPPLSRDEWRRAFDALARLRREALDRLVELVAEAPPDAETLPALDPSHLEALLERMGERVALVEPPTPESRAPLVGPLVTRLRRLWLDTMVRPYIVPILQRQAEYNARAGQALIEAARQIRLHGQAWQAVRRALMAQAADETAILEALWRQAGGQE